MTYAKLAKAAGLSQAAVESIGTRNGYNATLEVVDKLCRALGSSPADILEQVDDPIDGSSGEISGN
jgi:DNA-binding Xre family transcriptional regulator